jgi:hypothetical protein
MHDVEEHLQLFYCDHMMTRSLTSVLRSHPKEPLSHPLEEPSCPVDVAVDAPIEVDTAYTTYKPRISIMVITFVLLLTVLVCAVYEQRSTMV